MQAVIGSEVLLSWGVDVGQIHRKCKTVVFHCQKGWKPLVKPWEAILVS